MKLPLSYDQFKKNPIKAILFMVLTAVVFLYVENRINYTKQIDKCEYQYQVCEMIIDLNKSYQSLVKKKKAA